MPRVLIVTGSYAPTMIADMHRARQLAWELPKLGWDVEILCPNGSYQPRSCLDTDSAAFFAPDTPTHYVTQYLPTLFWALKIGSIGPRALMPMVCAGRRLLKRRRYELIYISTAQFLLFLLGPVWQKQFGIPFVLDFHDPFYREETGLRSGFKHHISRRLSKYVEYRAVTAASGLVSVSPTYLDLLHRRYAETKPAWLMKGRQALIPFAVAPRDLEEAARGMRTWNEAPRGRAKIVYVGTGGPIMIRSFSLLCRALLHLRERRGDLLENVRIELHGTMSAHAEVTDQRLVGLARELGLADVVTEDPARVTYRRSLELLLQSDGALILGVDDPGYMPSKLFTYAYSGKPILASVHRDGPALSAFQKIAGLGYALWFCESGEMSLFDAANVVGAFVEDVVNRRKFDRRSSLELYSFSAMAQQHAELFEACLQ